MVVTLGVYKRGDVTRGKREGDQIVLGHKFRLAKPRMFALRRVGKKLVRSQEAPIPW